MGKCALLGQGGKKIIGTATPSNVSNGKTFVGTTGKLETGTLALSGTATAGDVKSGKTFYNTSESTKVTGTMVVNYDGYKVVRGSKSLSDVKALNGIPLTARFNLSFSGTWDKETGHTHSADIILTFSGYSSMTIGSTSIYAQAVSFYGGDDYSKSATTSGMDVDLETRCSGDLTKMKAFTGISSGGSLSSITKWLEPIS